jgi:hypothetical protein
MIETIKHKDKIGMQEQRVCIFNNLIQNLDLHFVMEKKFEQTFDIPKIDFKLKLLKIAKKMKINNLNGGSGKSLPILKVSMLLKFFFIYVCLIVYLL